MVRIKKGDSVRVICGKDLGKTGSVIRVLPKINKVIVSGINIYKKHLRPSRKNPQGGIIDKALPIHLSNIKKIEPVEAKK